jgi:hypothetical protein
MTDSQRSDNSSDQPGNEHARNPSRGRRTRPGARRAAALRKALRQAVGEDDVRQIAQAMVQQAKRGDVAAAMLVLGSAVGGPVGRGVTSRPAR